MISPVVCSVSKLGSREFICIGHDVFPIDRIASIDTTYPDTTYPDHDYGDTYKDDSSIVDSVRIFLIKPKQELCWSDEADAKAIRYFLMVKGFVVDGKVV